jgi:hypothetical protein
MATRSWAHTIGLAALLTLGSAVWAGCSTLSGARPLDRGQHEVGAVIGGPMLRFGVPIPFPNVVVGARSGLPELADRPFDLGYGLNLTGLPYGVLAVHGDLGWQLNDQNGPLPAFTVRNKVFLQTNVIAGNKADGVRRGLALADELDLYASWGLNPEQSSLFFVSLAQTLDFVEPSLILTPGIGTEIDPGGRGGWRFQGELRWWAINRGTLSNNAAWIPKNPGAIGIHFGVAYGFGGAR